MNTIVLNTLTGAVSEYTRHAFHGITPTHGGNALGLFAFGAGDTDGGLPIVSEVRVPGTLRETTLKKRMDTVYVSLKGAGDFEASVFGEQESWAYTFPARPSGQSRCQVGRGIRENYLGLGVSNPAGQAFFIDRIEVLVRESKNRRV